VERALHGDRNIGKTQMLNGHAAHDRRPWRRRVLWDFRGWAMQFWVPTSMQEEFDPAGTNWKIAARVD